MQLLHKLFPQHKREVGRRWRMDEPNLNIKSKWKYLYRAIDTAGRTIAFLLTARRDDIFALRSFRKVISYHGKPEVFTIDTSGANTAALTMLNVGKP